MNARPEDRRRSAPHQPPYLTGNRAAAPAGPIPGRICVSPRQMRPGDDIRIGGEPRTVVRVTRIEGGASVLLSTGERLTLSSRHEYAVIRQPRPPGRAR